MLREVKSPLLFGLAAAAILLYLLIVIFGRRKRDGAGRETESL